MLAYFLKFFFKDTCGADYTHGIDIKTFRTVNSLSCLDIQVRFDPIDDA